MTTITIDTDINLEKTHFDNPLEAAYVLLWLQINEYRNNDPFWIEENQKNKLAYKKSILWQNEKFTISQAKKLLLWNTK